MAAAAEWTLRDRQIEQKHEAQLRDELWTRIAGTFPAAKENGDSARRLANTLNLSFPGFDSETTLMALDLEGVCASSGSACTSGSLDPSHVLLAMGCDPARARASVRFSLGLYNTEAEVDFVLKQLPPIVAKLRAHQNSGTGVSPV
jgi:cysteine desulfurase